MHLGSGEYLELLSILLQYWEATIGLRWSYGCTAVAGAPTLGKNPTVNLNSLIEMWIINKKAKCK